MKPVRAEFVPRSPVPRGWWFAVAALAAAAVVLALLTRQASLDTEAARAERGATRAAKDAARADTPPAPPPPAYEASARAMIAQRAIAWPELLTAIESVQVPGVRLLNVDFSVTDAAARVEIAFTAQSQVLDYVAELNVGLPATGLAWRWGVLRIEQRSRDMPGRAHLMARWAER